MTGLHPEARAGHGRVECLHEHDADNGLEGAGREFLGAGDEVSGSSLTIRSTPFWLRAVLRLDWAAIVLRFLRVFSYLRAEKSVSKSVSGIRGRMGVHQTHQMDA
jgi:hypothetical protein